MNTAIRSIAVFLLTLALAACGGRQSVHPECVDDYDACINACAYQCEESPSALDSQHADQEPTVDTWSVACQRCTDQCQDVADQCGDR